MTDYDDDNYSDNSIVNDLEPHHAGVIEQHLQYRPPYTPSSPPRLVPRTLLPNPSSTTRRPMRRRSSVSSSSSSSTTTSLASKRSRLPHTASDVGSDNDNETNSFNNADDGDESKQRRKKPRRKTIHRPNYTLGAIEVACGSGDDNDNSSSAEPLSSQPPPLDSGDGNGIVNDDDGDSKRNRIDFGDSDQETRVDDARAYEAQRMTNEEVKEHMHERKRQQAIRDAVIRNLSNGGDDDEEGDDDNPRNFEPIPLLIPPDLKRLPQEHREREIKGMEELNRKNKDWCFLCKYSQASNQQRIRDYGHMGGLLKYIDENMSLISRTELCKGIQYRYENYLRECIEDPNDRFYWPLMNIFEHITQHDRSVRNRLELGHELNTIMIRECQRGVFQRNKKTKRTVIDLTIATKLMALMNQESKLLSQLGPYRNSATVLPLSNTRH